jgi:hypothetical protein
MTMERTLGLPVRCSVGDIGRAGLVLPLVEVHGDGPMPGALQSDAGRRVPPGGQRMN